jgi:hypothetical protein
MVKRGFISSQSEKTRSGKKTILAKATAQRKSEFLAIQKTTLTRSKSEDHTTKRLNCFQAEQISMTKSQIFNVSTNDDLSKSFTLERSPIKEKPSEATVCNILPENFINQELKARLAKRKISAALKDQFAMHMAEVIAMEPAPYTWKWYLRDPIKIQQKILKEELQANGQMFCSSKRLVEVGKRLMKLRSPKIYQLKFASARKEVVFNVYNEKDLPLISDNRIINHQQDHDNDSNHSKIQRDTAWCIHDLICSTRNYHRRTASR